MAKMPPKDTNGDNLSTGDNVIFGENSRHGTIVGFEEETGFVKVKVVKELYGAGGSKVWQWIFVFPPMQAIKIKDKSNKKVDKKLDQSAQLSIMTSHDGD